jgi:Family of unknown function (DUF5923)
MQVLLQVGYILEPNCNSHGNQIRDLGHQSYDGNYKSYLDSIFSVGDWFKTVGDIPLTSALAEIGRG